MVRAMTVSTASDHRTVPNVRPIVQQLPDRRTDRRTVALARGRRQREHVFGRIGGANHDRDGAVKAGDGCVRPVQRARDGVETRLMRGQ